MGARALTFSFLLKQVPQTTRATRKWTKRIASQHFRSQIFIFLILIVFVDFENFPKDLQMRATNLSVFCS